MMQERASSDYTELDEEAERAGFIACDDGTRDSTTTIAQRTDRDRDWKMRVGADNARGVRLSLHIDHR